MSIAEPPAELIERSINHLRERGIVRGDVRWRTLGGGISNWVVAIDGVVVKAALAQLRVEEEWNADPMRAVHEAHAIEAVAKRLRAGEVPEIVFVDEELHAFGMKAAPAGSVDWKSQLLAGAVDLEVAERTGDLLGRLHRTTWRDCVLAARFADIHLFEELRLGPYHTRAAAIASDRGDELLATRLLEERDAMRGSRTTLVHGDFSPKNILVAAERTPMLIDFEVVHFGNPDFDTGFMLTHLLMKAIHRPQLLQAYRAAALRLLDTYIRNVGEVRTPEATRRGALLQAGALLVARVDGKSKVEYLDDSGRLRARAVGRAILMHELDLDAAFEAATR